MQQNTHRLVRLIRATTPHVPSQTPTPQLSKQMLHAYPIPRMYIIIRLFRGHQNSILSSGEWHNSAIYKYRNGPQPQYQRITSGTRWSIPIPNQNIKRCPRGQGAYPYNVAQHINGNSKLANMRRTLRIPQVSTPYPQPKGPQKVVDCECISPTQGATHLWIIWCG